VVGGLIVLHNYLNFTSSNYLEASIKGVTEKLRLVWLLIFAVLILQESLNWYKIVGTTMAILAGILIIGVFRRPEHLKGIVLSSSATVIYASVIILYKILFQSFNSFTLTFFVFFIPAVLNVFLIPHAIPKIVKMFNEDGKAVFLASAAGAFANLTMIYALSLGEVSRVSVMIESFLVVILVFEHVWLKERKNVIIKLAAVLLAILGGLFIKLS